MESVRRAIEQRAGLVRASDGPRTGELRGHIDLVSETCIAGWAQNVDHPEAAVSLDIYAGGRLIGQTLAIAKTCSEPASAVAATPSRSRRRRGSLCAPTRWRCAARSTGRRLNSQPYLDVHCGGSRSRR